MSAALRGVLFDLDGVLADYDRAVRVRYLATALGSTPDAVHAAIYTSGIEEAGDSGALDTAAYLDALGRRLGTMVTVDAWTAARKAATRVRPDVLALAEQLARQMCVALLTNNNELLTRHLAQIAPGLLPLFAGRAFASAQFGASKPAPGVYLACLEQLGVSPASTLFVDDCAANVEGARQAGLHAHHYVGLSGLRNALELFAPSH